MSCNVMSLLLCVSIFFIKVEDEELADKIGHKCLNVKLKRISWIADLSIGFYGGIEGRFFALKKDDGHQHNCQY